ncbi:hypothetical protein MMC20_005856 [Loxospora ochrophaea]|nr:hypothetical protein [Loxospora ochrophaea]
MLGRLLQSAASTFSHPPSSPLESVTEEAHTYALLYPDANALRQAQHNVYLLPGGRSAADTTTYDDRGGLDVEYPRDIRIIIAQDANASYQQPQVLYDSKPPTLSSDRTRQLPSKSNLAETPAARPIRAQHNRRSSLFQSSQAQVNHRGSFGSAEHNRDHTPTRPTSSENELRKELKEETDALLGCMFGATGFRLISGTKLHIKPSPRELLHQPAPRPGSAPQFGARSTIGQRENRVGASAGPESDTTPSTTLSRKPSILITRMFSIDMPSKGSPGNPSYGANGINMKSDVQKLADANASEKLKQKRIPMYAIAAVMHLPLAPVLRKGPPSSPLISSPQALTSPDLDTQIDQVLTHWNVIIRALIPLEDIIKGEICKSLESLDLSNVPPSPNTVGKESPRSRSKSSKAPNQQSIYVNAGCLQQLEVIQKQVKVAGKRIAGGLKTRRVIAGQSRWGAWREEARWVDRWAGGKEQNFFLFNILTAFLGSHTSWLDSLGPSWHRRRHAFQQNARHEDEAPIQQRTVIISTDKMAARRLIFLLSAFLPNSRTMSAMDVAFRGKTPQSIANSPRSPTFLSGSRQPSLRRTINRRPLKSSHLSTGHGRSVSFSVNSGSGDTAQGTEKCLGDRRLSDARSAISASLPTANHDPKARKTSISTVLADSALPVPHFSSAATDPVTLPVEARPGSSGSLASQALSRTLNRSDSTNRTGSSAHSRSASRWGSSLSGFWSARRDSSTEESDPSASPEEMVKSAGIAKGSQGSQLRHRAGKLRQMVGEADRLLDPYGAPGEISPTEQAGQSHLEELGTIQTSTPAQDIPYRSRPNYSQTQLSVDEKDGIIDIDLPLAHSFSSSLASTLSFPHFGNTAPSSLDEHYNPYGRPSTPDFPPHKSDSPINIAGWLKEFHDDFVLQAVRPYEKLTGDIKQSMRREPHFRLPHITSMEADGSTWIDFCTTLIADTTTFSIQRLRLRRKFQKPQSECAASTQKNEEAWRMTEEEIVEEPIMDMDPTLIDAVERILAQSGHSSRVTSRAPSPSRHDERRHPLSDIPTLEVPRSECKKTVLGALEQVVRSVNAEQVPGDRGSHRNGHLGSRYRRGEGTLADSTLREGVRKWLHDVEESF